jgi:DNA polymerase
VIGHVHDEIIVEVVEGCGSVGEMERIMSEVPAWAEGMPIGAEGYRAKRYRK